MTSSAFIIFAGETDCRIGVVASGVVSFIDVEIAAETTPTQTAGQLAVALKAAGYDGQGVVLAIPSGWCLAAAFATDDLPAGDRRAMLYRLEEKLPLAAEAVIADFVSGERMALGVCVRRDAVQPLVDALEAAGVAVQSITPAALAAAQAIAADEQSTLLLCLSSCTDARQIDLIAIESGRLANWALVPVSAADVKLQLDLLLVTTPAGSTRLQVFGDDTGLAWSLAETTSLQVDARAGHVATEAAKACAEISAGRKRPWIEFRRGPLAIRDSLRQHRKPLDALLGAAVALLLACAVGMLVRAERFHHLRQNYESQTSDAFRAQFPGWSIPANVRAVIESEHRKAAVSSRAGAPTDASASALQTLHDVLARLPGDGRFAIDRMVFRDTDFELQGRLRSFEQLDAIAASARQAGLDVPPPQSRRIADGLWSFTLRGARPSAARPAGSETITRRATE